MGGRLGHEYPLPGWSWLRDGLQCAPLAQFQARRACVKRLLSSFNSGGNLTECAGGEKIERTCKKVEAETRMKKISWELTIV